MIKGLYSAFTAMEAAWRYQDVLANNIANATTAGYKREVAAQQSFEDVLLSQSATVPAPFAARIQAVVGTIGTGKFITDFQTDFADGAFQATGNELDLALDDGFFSVETPDGQVFLTRDGRFGRDANNDLVTSHGYFVLNEKGGHIRLPDGPVSIAQDGTITSATGEPVERIAVTDFVPARLQRAGEGFFVANAAGTPINGGMRQGFTEMSNANLGEELVTLMTVHRAFQANQTVLARLDQTLNQAAGELGTVR